MGKYLVLVGALLLSSCAPLQRFAVAPHRTLHHYRHWQRKHERERRRLAKDNITWSTL